jgi:hypothetical protein
MYPPHGIFYDQAYGPEASALTKKLIMEGQVIEVVTANSHDYFGRLLSFLIIDGQQLGVLQIKAGLAYQTFLRYPDDYKPFPDLLAELQDAWENDSPIQLAIRQGLRPDVVDPDFWRKKNQHNDLSVTLDQWQRMTQEEQEALVARARERSGAP